MKDENNSATNTLRKKIIALSIGVLCIILFISSCHIVPAGHKGVYVMFGKVGDKTLAPGIHLLNPLSNVIDFDVRLKSATAEKAEGSTSDLQNVSEDITMNYSFSPNYVNVIYSTIGTNATIESTFIVPALYEIFKSVSSEFTAEQLVTQRSQISAEIVKRMQEKLKKYDILVSDINIQNFKFDKNFSDAIEQKVVASQNKLTAEQNLEKSKIEAQQKVVEAQGQAQAIQIQAEAIKNQGGNEIIQLKAIEKWNGQLPTYYSGAGMPFINFNNVK